MTNRLTNRQGRVLLNHTLTVNSDTFIQYFYLIFYFLYFQFEFVFNYSDQAEMKVSETETIVAKDIDSTNQTSRSD